MPSKILKSNQPRGFTLIELLIAVTIISILSVVGLVSYSSFLKNSRDNKRQADLKFIQSALEEYHADLLIYPTPGEFNAILQSGGTFTSNIGRGSITAPATLKTYFNSLPKDPTNSTPTPYCYIATPASCANNITTNCTSYTLYAKLENPPSGAAASTCGGQSYDFVVTPP